ncbi:uncharacterized protein LOC129594145 [Paramacrobiotus metropolitanus]|uniref:uncharacterized protein LOC129594145 n=1 Tax=Paramacrobiotus metropolitanus TaxID=2943436 RepID=UPI00244586A4|nr:uncharacterized protein LOC129594145 [Paramacrobiotus metropolitanus]
MGINASFPIDKPIPPLSLQLDNNRVKLRLNIDLTTEALIALLSSTERSPTASAAYEMASVTTGYNMTNISENSSDSTVSHERDRLVFMDEIPQAPGDSGIVVGQPVETAVTSTPTTAATTSTSAYTTTLESTTEYNIFLNLPPECNPNCPPGFTLPTESTVTTTSTTTSTSTSQSTTSTSTTSTATEATTPTTTTTPESTSTSTTLLSTISSTPESTPTTLQSTTSSTQATTTTTPVTQETTTSTVSTSTLDPFAMFYGSATAPEERILDVGVTPIPHYPRPTANMPKLTGPAICIPLQGHFIGNLFPVSQSLYWNDGNERNSVFTLLTDSLMQSNLSPEVKSALRGLELTKGQFVALLNKLNNDGLGNTLKLILPQIKEDVG